MWARVARFEGDPGTIDATIEELKGFAASSELPPELRGARMLVLVDRESGARLMISVFETEEALRSGDAVMNAGNPQNAGKRTSVEFFELAGELAL